MKKPKRTLKDAIDIIEGLAWQFGTRESVGCIPMLGTGRLPAMETAFTFLGWPYLRPCPDQKCQVDGCNQWATCGMTKDRAYLRVCGKHFSWPEP